MSEEKTKEDWFSQYKDLEAEIQSNNEKLKKTSTKKKTLEENITKI